MPEIKLTPKSEVRMRRGHPWVFSNEIASFKGDETDAAQVIVRSHKNDVLGSAFYNKHSLVSARYYSRKPEPFTQELLTARMRAAFARRRGDVCRLLFSEADGVPGLIVDQFESVLVFQLNNAAIDRYRELIVGQLIYHSDVIVEASVSPERIKEGLQPIFNVVHGDLPDQHTISVNGLKVPVKIGSSDVSTPSLEQRFNWRLVGGLARGKRVLDLYCGSGGFALNAMKGGATSVVAVDSSQSSLNDLQASAQLNGMEGIKTKVTDAVQYAKSAPDEFDLIVCDPPVQARSAKQLKTALRHYREMNRWCIGTLAPGGRLLTFTRSAGVSLSDFQDCILKASRDAGKQLRLLPFTAQPPDYPIFLGMPESNCLKGLLLEAIE